MGQDNHRFRWGGSEKSRELEYRQDSTKWDRKIYTQDISKYKNSKKPQGFFPTPFYNLVKNNDFYGVGYDGNFTGISIGHEKQVVYVYFYFKNQEKDEFIFFTLITTMESLIPKEQIPLAMQVNISSRNHPNYLSFGTIFNGINTVSFQAFYTGDHTSYAIINERIFDLSIGDIILLTPLKDGSLRSKQIRSPEIKTEIAKDAIEKLIEENKNFLKTGKY